jgi:hypothetical protein
LATLAQLGLVKNSTIAHFGLSTGKERRIDPRLLIPTRKELAAFTTRKELAAFG